MLDGETVPCNNIMFIIFFLSLSLEYVYLLLYYRVWVIICFIFFNTFSLIISYSYM